jgi:hypothetical protein
LSERMRATTMTAYRGANPPGFPTQMPQFPPNHLRNDTKTHCNSSLRD